MHFPKRSGMATHNFACKQAITYLPLLPNRIEHHRPLADTHFTVRRRVEIECWVDVGGWLYTEI